ncbi:MAG: NrfD/PsrC family molybdoenzyme membrane anchor subunit, partial [Desulfobacula sp.]
ALTLFKDTYTAEDRDRDRRIVHTLSIISLPAGLLFYGTNGAFFAILQNRPIWNSALTPLLFILSALLSGGALITFLISVFQRDEIIVKFLGRIVFSILGVFILLEIIQFFIGYQTGTTAIVTSLNSIVSGPQSWTFWVIHLLIGTLIPVILFITAPGSTKAVTWACFLIFMTFAAVRYNFLIPDLSVYKLEGLETTFFHQRLRTSYAPTLNEWLVSIWIISFGLLAFIFGTRWLPVISSGKGETDHV